MHGFWPRSARAKELNETLCKAGVPSEERQKISVAEHAKWKDEFATLEARIKAAERRNDSRFQEVTGEMFGRLADESFHAYLENFVYPRSSSDVPRWLNEGLAQTFEAGLLDGDSLRVYGTHAWTLALAEKATFLGLNPLPLAELLTADGDQFISTHRGDGSQSSRLWHLVLVGPGLLSGLRATAAGHQELEHYVSLDTTGQSEIDASKSWSACPWRNSKRLRG